MKVRGKMFQYENNAEVCSVYHNSSDDLENSQCSLSSQERWLEAASHGGPAWTAGPCLGTRILEGWLGRGQLEKEMKGQPSILYIHMFLCLWPIPRMFNLPGHSLQQDLQQAPCAVPKTAPLARCVLAASRNSSNPLHSHIAAKPFCSQA